MSSKITGELRWARVEETHGDRDRATESSVAALRAPTGPDVDDPRLEELVGELSVRSGRTRIDHPQVGELDLGYEKLPIADADPGPSPPGQHC
ncbi:MAG TPA: hypothetical protein VGH14_00150 [Solirubrobacterales bacterium]|jgi:hypothetical protein